MLRNIVGKSINSDFNKNSQINLYIIYSKPGAMLSSRRFEPVDKAVGNV